MKSKHMQILMIAIAILMAFVFKYSVDPSTLADIILALCTALLLIITIYSLKFSYTQYKMHNALVFETYFLNDDALQQSFLNIKKHTRKLERHETRTAKKCANSTQPRTYECSCCAQLHNNTIDSATYKSISKILNQWDCYANGVYAGVQANSVMYNTFGTIYVRHFFRLLPFIIQSQNKSLAHYQGAIWLAFKWLQDIEIKEIEGIMSISNLQCNGQCIDYARYQAMLKEARVIEKIARHTIAFHYNQAPRNRWPRMKMMQPFYKQRYAKYNRERVDLIESLINFRKKYCLSRANQLHTNQQVQALDCVLDKIAVY